jgi:hypothetical protein
MKEIVADKKQVAYCGLYCGSCKRFLNDGCLGCAGNEKATWCKVRSCCISNNFSSCADCTKFENASDCKDFNNFISKMFALIFRSDRNACISYIKSNGYDKYAEMMAENKIMSIRK